MKTNRGTISLLLILASYLGVITLCFMWFIRNDHKMDEAVIDGKATFQKRFTQCLVEQKAIAAQRAIQYETLKRK